MPANALAAGKLFANDDFQDIVCKRDRLHLGLVLFELRMGTMPWSQTLVHKQLSAQRLRLDALPASA